VEGFVSTSSWAESTCRALVEPPPKLGDGNESAAATPDDAQLVHDVLLEEVDADPQRLGRFGLAQREARNAALCLELGVIELVRSFHEESTRPSTELCPLLKPAENAREHNELLRLPAWPRDRLAVSPLQMRVVVEKGLFCLSSEAVVPPSTSD